MGARQYEYYVRTNCIVLPSVLFTLNRYFRPIIPNQPINGERQSLRLACQPFPRLSVADVYMNIMTLCIKYSYIIG